MDFLNTLEIILAVLLVLVILIQTPKSTLNLSSMGGGVQAGMQRRGGEKFLHIATIVLSIAFIANSTAIYLLS